jgi:hypothetical protein
VKGECPLATSNIQLKQEVQRREGQGKGQGKSQPLPENVAKRVVLKRISRLKTKIRNLRLLQESNFQLQDSVFDGLLKSTQSMLDQQTTRNKTLELQNGRVQADLEEQMGRNDLARVLSCHCHHPLIKNNSHLLLRPAFETRKDTKKQRKGVQYV